MQRAVISLIGGEADSTDRLRRATQQSRYLLVAFQREGIQNVMLMNRADRDQPYNVRPYGNAEKGTGWIGQGRIVKKGETSVRGLFHISQTEPLPTAKPATPAPKAKGKPKLAPVS